MPLSYQKALNQNHENRFLPLQCRQLDVRLSMSDRLPLNDEEQKARSLLVASAREMLSGELSYHEGAVTVLRLRSRVGGVHDFDEDFNAFVVISSETDHLPLKAQRPFWDRTALERMGPEYESAEGWAKSFAPSACDPARTTGDMNCSDRDLI